MTKRTGLWLILFLAWPLIHALGQSASDTELTTLFLETFDSGEDAETAAPVPLADLGWAVHHSHAGINLDGLQVAEETVLAMETSASAGDHRLGEPIGYVSFFTNNYDFYGQGEEGSRPDLPGPHPESGDYFHNRTLAHFLWTAFTVSPSERERLREFNFVQGNRDASQHSFMPAVRIGEAWYVHLVDEETLGAEVRILGRAGQTDPNGAETVFSGDQFTENGAFANYYNAQPYRFAWSETGWVPLTFDGGQETDSTLGMTLGEPLSGALPEGEITGLGVYSPENITNPYNFNGYRVDSIELLADPPPPSDLFTFTFNNEGKVDGADRPIQAAKWDGIYSAEALPLVTGEAVFADLSEGTSADPTPGHYKAGFLFVSGKNDQPAPEAFLVYSTTTDVVSVPQTPVGGINPQVSWHSDAPNSVNDLTALLATDIREMGMRIRPRNAEVAAYHFALQFNGEWYVNETPFMHSGSGDWEAVSLDAAGAVWLGGVVGEDSLNVDFATDPPSPTSLVGIGQVPLDSVGIYISTGLLTGENDTWARVDSITLLAEVPPLDPPALLEQPESLTVNEGETATFTVVAEEGDDPLTYQWQKGGADLTDADGPTLVLEAVLPADEGMYTVVVSGPGGDVVSEPAELTVLAKPTVFPETLEVPAERSDQLVTVDAVSGVDWTAESGADWIVITYGTAGSGSDIVMFTVSANEVTESREGSLTVAGIEVVITQAAAEVEETFEALVRAESNDEGGWTSPWFGDFWLDEEDWIYHRELGWIYAGFAGSADNMILFSLVLDTWLWTSELYYNALYDFGREGYILYFIGDEGRVFLFDYGTLIWEEI